MKEQFKIAPECAELITKHFKKPIDLEFEKFMYPFFLYEKKRYAYQEWTEYTGPHEKLEYKGVATVRRDYCKFVKEVCNTLFEILMKGPNRDGKGNPDSYIGASIEYVKISIENLFNNKIPIEKLIISKSLKGSYKINGEQTPWTDSAINMPHVRVAQKLKEINPADHPKPPDRVPYVFIVNKSKTRLQCDRVAHPNYLGTHKIDSLYYFDHQLKEPVSQIFDLMVENPETIYKALRLKKINEMNNQSQITTFFIPKHKNDDEIKLKEKMKIINRKLDNDDDDDD